MTHLSEKVSPLKEKIVTTLYSTGTENEVWFLNLPFFPTDTNLHILKDLTREINLFVDRLNENSVICIHTSPFYAATFLSEMSPTGHYKLWIGVKLSNPINSQGKLSQHHSSLIIITKYKESLKHTKTRIEYSYCPSCNKTTKDYGGKKHLYDEYGTLISDVWRDISVDLNGSMSEITSRLRDLFGLELYKELKIIDLRKSFPQDSGQLVHGDEGNLQELGILDSRLINGDCLSELRKIPSNSVDFCFADPPYNVNKKYETWDDNIDIIEYFKWCDEWIYELSRIIKPGRIVSILNIPQWTVRHFQYLLTQLSYHDWIIWEGLSLPVRMIMPSHYSIICFSKGNPRPLPGLSRERNSKSEEEGLLSQKEFFCARAGCVNKRKKLGIEDKVLSTNLWWDIHRLKHNSRRVDHPTQLPPMFMKRLITLFSNEGEWVLDPFNGSGTTTLCAQQLNRNYIGIELSQKYFDISNNRHQDLINGLDPFRKTDDVPKSKNSYVKRISKQSYKVSKKTLQLEIKGISKNLGHIPTREEVIQQSKYPIEFYDNYFINWSEVTAAARTTGMREDKSESNVQGKLFDDNLL